MNNNQLSVKVSNELSEIPRLGETVEDFCAMKGIPRKSALNLCLALDEILTNIISYAFEDGAHHDIEVTMVYDGHHLGVEIIDDGRAFDPLQAPTADITSTLEDRAIGGLGIHLVKSLMDTVEYFREHDRNHLRLGKRISASGAAT